jgi:hypothetical protein
MPRGESGGDPTFAGFVFPAPFVFGAADDGNGTDDQKQEQDSCHEQNLIGIVSQASLLQSDPQYGLWRELLNR